MSTPGRGPGGHPPDPLVVGVEDRRAVGRQRLDELALGPLDRVERADPATGGRGWTAVTTPIRGRADRGQLGDLAADVHAHLEDGGLVLRAEAQDGQRQADLVVLVALALERPEAAAQDRRDRVLRRGLGDGAGDADDERVEPAPPGRRDGLEGASGSGHADDGHVAEGVDLVGGRCG